MPQKCLELGPADPGAAEAVGAMALRSIEENKLADLLLLDADPPVDVRNAEKLCRLVKDGWIFDPRELARSRCRYLQDYGMILASVPRCRLLFFRSAR